MEQPQAIDELIATTLKVSTSAVTDALSFGDHAAWDSLTHIKLIEAIEQTYGVTIGDEEMLELTSVQAIREFVGKMKGQ
ncbi:MAG: acyl carrier protein [Nitrospira sp.]